MIQRQTMTLAAAMLVVFLTVFPVAAAGTNADGTAGNQAAGIFPEGSLNVTATNPPPATPAPTTSPGFGALVVLAGIGAGAFIVLRRH
jgi:PGF-CTERM protein